jgi:hypothetical protein
VHEAVVLIAQLDEVGQVRRPAVRPVQQVMDIRELGVGAAREPAALVPPPDLDALRIGGIAPGPTEVEALTGRSVSRNEDFGIAGNATGDLP